MVTAKGVLAESPSLTFCSLTIIGSTLLTAGISRVAVFSVVGSTWAVVFSSVVILAGLFSAFIATATGAGVVDDPCLGASSSFFCGTVGEVVNTGLGWGSAIIISREGCFAAVKRNRPFSSCI